jgi:hypothetical protein
VFFMDGHIYCLVCGQPFARKTGEHCCGKRECRAFRAIFIETTMFEFLMLNLRWRGGEGLETPRELMEKAVEELPVSSDLLAELLIKNLEET